jgi:hypothetical protein
VNNHNIFSCKQNQIIFISAENSGSVMTDKDSQRQNFFNFSKPLSTEVRNDSHSEFVTASKNSNDDRQLNLTEEQDTSEPRLKTEGANFKLIFLSLML